MITVLFPIKGKIIFFINDVFSCLPDTVKHENNSTFVKAKCCLCVCDKY